MIRSIDINDDEKTYAIGDGIFDCNWIPVMEPPNELAGIGTFFEQELQDTVSVKEV